MKNRFEQLIEYVINDEEQKARELFHDIVVEKSRSIYEDLMAEEAEEESVEEAKEHEEESVEENLVVVPTPEGEEIEEDDAMGRMDKYDEGMGGDQADDLIDDVSVEEEGINMEAEGDDEHGSMEDLEDRVMSLEDKLDGLMAEFEAELGGGDKDMDMDMDMDMEVDATDTPDMTSVEVDDDEMETEGMMEAISLKSAPAPVKSEEGGVNKKGVVAANSGAKGAMAKPVAASTQEEKGRSAPGTKDLITDFQNKAGDSMKDQKPATKPHLAQATGVNTRTPFPKA